MLTTHCTTVFPIRAYKGLEIPWLVALSNALHTDGGLNRDQRLAIRTSYKSIFAEIYALREEAVLM